MKIPFTPALVPEFLQSLVGALPEKSLLSLRRVFEKKALAHSSGAGKAPAQPGEIKIKKVVVGTKGSAFAVNAELSPVDCETLITRILDGNDSALLKKIDGLVFDTLAGKPSSSAASALISMPVDFASSSAAEVANAVAGLSKEAIVEAQMCVSTAMIGTLPPPAGDVTVRGSVLITDTICLELSGPGVSTIVKSMIGRVPSNQLPKLGKLLVDHLMA